MSGPRLLWPRKLADVPGFPAELVAALAAHRVVTVGDLVARIKQHNPGLIPPSHALHYHVWLNQFPVLDREPARRAEAALVAYLGYGEHERPADWTDPPASAAKPTPTPTPEPPMAFIPRYVRPQSLSLHPEAAIVPEMPPDQYTAFLADVKARNVILKPIDLHLCRSIGPSMKFTNKI